MTKSLETRPLKRIDRNRSDRYDGAARPIGRHDEAPQIRQRCFVALHERPPSNATVHAYSKRKRSRRSGRRRLSKAWHKALARAGIENFRWHDLRHTWCSWHVQGGTPLFALQELAGWESERMVRRYAHLAAEHLSVYASRLGSLRRTRRSFRCKNSMNRNDPMRLFPSEKG